MVIGSNVEDLFLMLMYVEFIVSSKDANLKVYFSMCVGVS